GCAWSKMSGRPPSVHRMGLRDTVCVPRMALRDSVCVPRMGLRDAWVARYPKPDKIPRWQAHSHAYAEHFSTQAVPAFAQSHGLCYDGFSVLATHHSSLATDV